MAVTPLWKFYLADLKGVRIAEVTNCKTRKVVTRLNKPSTIEFSMETFNPAMPYLMGQGNQHLLIQATRADTLVAQCEIAGGSMVGAGASIQVSATCTAYERLRQRYVGKSVAGNTYGGDRSAIITTALAEINAEKATGVTMGTTSTTSTISAGPYRYKNFLDLLNELGATISGYDHWITLAAASSGSYGQLNVTALRGAYKPNVVFEYGTGQRNARDWSYKWDTLNRITRGIHLPPSFPDNTALTVIERPTVPDAAIEDTEGVGRRVAIIEGDLYDTTLRQNLVDEHVAIRKYPRELFEIQPAIQSETNQPQPFQDYDVGDQIEGRVLDNGIAYLDAIVRIYGITIELDENGTESVTLLLVDE